MIPEAKYPQYLDGIQHHYYQSALDLLSGVSANPRAPGQPTMAATGYFIIALTALYCCQFLLRKPDGSSPRLKGGSKWPDFFIKA